jgi:hypothetical protein
MATLLNANGDLISAMLVTRLPRGKSGFLKSLYKSRFNIVFSSITKACFTFNAKITVV